MPLPPLNHSSTRPCSRRDEVHEKFDQIEKSVARTARHLTRLADADRQAREASIDEHYRDKEKELTTVLEQAARHQNKPLSRDFDGAVGEHTPSESFLRVLGSRENKFQEEMAKRTQQRDALRLARQQELEELSKKASAERSVLGDLNELSNPHASSACAPSAKSRNFSLWSKSSYKRQHQKVSRK